MPKNTECSSTKANIEEITANIHDTQRRLTILTPATAKQNDAICKAQEALAMWEKNKLNAVQKAFEEIAS